MKEDKKQLIGGREPRQKRVEQPLPRRRGSAVVSRPSPLSRAPSPTAPRAPIRPQACVFNESHHIAPNHRIRQAKRSNETTTVGASSSSRASPSPSPPHLSLAPFRRQIRRAPRAPKTYELKMDVDEYAKGPWSTEVRLLRPRAGRKDGPERERQRRQDESSPRSLKTDAKKTARARAALPAMAGRVYGGRGGRGHCHRSTR